MNRRALLAAVLACSVLPGAGAQETDGYKLPPDAITALVDAPPVPHVSLDPTRRFLVLQERPSLPPIAELARPELRLAGLRIDPRTNGPSREGWSTALTLEAIGDLTTRAVTGLPPGARIGAPSWSPDGKRFAFALTREAAIELWVAEVSTAAARPLAGVRLNAANGSPFRWLPDSGTLVVKTVPAGRGPAPEAPVAPSGPAIQESTGGKKAPSRTYQDLLRSAHDEAALEWALACQLESVSVATGERSLLGTPGLVEDAAPSPDGKWLLVETLHRPFSRLVPVGRFPRRVEVWRLPEGTLARVLADVPLQEAVPVSFSAAPTGPRAFGWRGDAPATVHWVEARDGGDPKRAAEVRDEVFVLGAPFDAAAVVLASLPWRYSGVAWSSDALALVTSRRASCS